MRRLFLWLALLCFVLAAAAAHPRAARLNLVPWIPIGLALYVASVLVAIGSIEID